MKQTQKEFKFWLGIGFGYDVTTHTGGNGRGSISFVTKEWTFLCFKYSICTAEQK